MAVFSGEELEKLGFEYVEEDEGCYYQYVLDVNNYFFSDYLYSEKIDVGMYKVIQYLDGENKELLNWEVLELTGNTDFGQELES